MPHIICRMTGVLGANDSKQGVELGELIRLPEMAANGAIEPSSGGGLSAY